MKFFRRCSGVPAAALLALCAALPLRAQKLSEYQEFYRLMRVNALEQVVFCYPTETPEREPATFAVRRDAQGRPVEVMRFFFGNPHTRMEWTMMKIAYITSDSTGAMLVRRTFHAANGVPLKVGYGYGEDVLYRGNGQIVRHRLIDRNDELLKDVPVVSQSRYQYDDAGAVVREWRFASGKLHWGWMGDGPMRPFGEIPQGGYFRRYTVNDRGELQYEELQGIGKKPFPFGGGEFAHAYELNECGQTLRVTYLDISGRPMADSAGIAAIAFRYDDFGRQIERLSLGLDGKPKAGPDGVARVTSIYHEFDGTLLRSEKFDERGIMLETQSD